jgi:hypothetical protein
MKASAHALAETARAARREVRAVLDERIYAVSMHGEEIRPRSRDETQSHKQRVEIEKKKFRDGNLPFFHSAANNHTRKLKKQNLRLVTTHACTQQRWRF